MLYHWIIFFNYSLLNRKKLNETENLMFFCLNKHTKARATTWLISHTCLESFFPPGKTAFVSFIQIKFSFPSLLCMVSSVDQSEGPTAKHDKHTKILFFCFKKDVYNTNFMVLCWQQRKIIYTISFLFHGIEIIDICLNSSSIWLLINFLCCMFLATSIILWLLNDICWDKMLSKLELAI